MTATELTDHSGQTDEKHVTQATAHKTNSDPEYSHYENASPPSEEPEAEPQVPVSAAFVEYVLDMKH